MDLLRNGQLWFDGEYKVGKPHGPGKDYYRSGPAFSRSATGGAGEVINLEKSYYM